MPLHIPEQYAPRIRSLLEFPDERRQEFLKALADAGSFFNVNDLAQDVSSKTKIPIPITDNVMQVLGKLYTIREEKGIPVEEFVDGEVRQAVEQMLVPPPEKKDEKTARWVKEETESRWNKFRNILITALSLDDTLGAAAKA